MKTLITALILATTSASFASGLTCSDVTGKLRLVVERYKGGMAPMPEQVVREQRWYYGSRLVSETLHFGNGKQVDVKSIMVQWLGEKVVVEKIPVLPDGAFAETYVRKVKVTYHDNTLFGERSLVTQMLCHKVPPPPVP